MGFLILGTALNLYMYVASLIYVSNNENFVKKIEKNVCLRSDVCISLLIN